MTPIIPGVSISFSMFLYSLYPFTEVEFCIQGVGAALCGCRAAARGLAATRAVPLTGLGIQGLGFRVKGRV